MDVCLRTVQKLSGVSEKGEDIRIFYFAKAMVFFFGTPGEALQPYLYFISTFSCATHYIEKKEIKCLYQRHDFHVRHGP